MTHFMKLSPSAFCSFAYGEKRVEMRLYDEKRRALRVGDYIIFNCTDLGRLQTEIVGIKVFKDFNELYAAYPPRELGYKAGETARPEDMLAYYTRDEQEKYGVVAIETAGVKGVL